MHLTNRHLRWLLRTALLTIAYYVSARISIALVTHDESVFSPVWVPSGIALAAVLRWGPGVAVGAVIAEFLVSLDSGARVGVALGLGIGNGLEPIIGAWLLHRMNFYWRITRVRDVFAVLGAALVSASVSSTIALITVSIADGFSSWSDTANIWWVFSASVVLGVVLVTPFLLTWLPFNLRPLTFARAAEAIVLLASLTVVSWLAFTERPLDGALQLLLFPLLAWAVLRFQQRGATGSVVVVGTVAAMAVFQNGLTLAQLSSIHSAQAIQGLLAVVTVTTLLLAAMLEERDDAAEAARRLAERLGEAQAIAHVGSWDATLTHEDFHWSRELCRLFGIDPEQEDESLETLLSHVHEGDREQLRAELERSSANCEPFSIEHRVVGHDRVVHHTGRIIGEPSDVKCRVAAAAVDITEHRSIERIRDALIATASHELRTPLTSVIGFASTLDNRWDNLSEEQRREMASIIHDQGIRLSSIVDDTLMQSRLDGGAIIVHPEAVSIADAIAEARAVLDGDVPPVTVHCPTELRCAGHPDHLQRVLTNLLSNAAKYGELPITIDATQRFGTVRIRVSDRGPGVTSEFEPRMFDRFARGFGTDAQPGTGLGLSIVHGLLEAGGGSISYEHVDGRTTFTVVLPEWVEPEPDQKPGSTSSQQAARGHTPM